MASGFGDRQRVEEFARLLDGLDDASGSGVATLDRPHPIPGQRPAPGTASAAAAGLRTGADDELASMLRAVAAVIDLGERHAPTVSPTFREALGRRLHAEFAALFGTEGSGSDGEGGEPAGRHRTAAAAWRRRLLSGGLVIGITSGSFGGVAWAASGALPGDPLYGVKRGLENMRVSVSGSDMDRGRQYTGQANTRLQEIHHLLDRKDANVDGTATSALIATTMDSLHQDVDNAGRLLVPLAEHGDANALTAMTQFLAAAEPQATDLQILLAPESRDKARRLVVLMQSYDARLAAAKTAIERTAAERTRPATNSTPGGRPHGATPSASPTAVSDTTGQASDAGRGSQPGSGAKSDAPNAAAAPPTPDPTVSVEVPLGSPATTFVVPPLLSGLPPIGITLGSAAPPTGPTTDAGPPPTDPNPN